MKPRNKNTWIALIAVAAVVGFFIYQKTKPEPPGALDGFAVCLKEKKATMYGAFWCPHCQAQKQLFENSVHLLPYVECSTPDGQAQNAECNAKNIQGYPTWIFADGSRQEQEMSLDELAKNTGCVLPK